MSLAFFGINQAELGCLIVISSVAPRNAIVVRITTVIPLVRQAVIPM